MRQNFHFDCIGFIWWGDTRKQLREAAARDFPGGPVVKNPPTNAEDTGSIPGQGTKIPHALEQLRSHATTTEPKHHS